ncbi:hypothetical protein G6F46_015260 [Rhizopus delemar]|nr:hypothetical protein G6F46_015260 [Rhizopus delemar]
MDLISPTFSATVAWKTSLAARVMPNCTLNPFWRSASRSDTSAALIDSSANRVATGRDAGSNLRCHWRARLRIILLKAASGRSS